jgi:hypothetical protein
MIMPKNNFYKKYHRFIVVILVIKKICMQLDGEEVA